MGTDQTVNKVAFFTSISLLILPVIKSEVLVVVGGWNGRLLQNTEVLDLSEQSRVCQDLSPFPVPLKRSVGQTINGEPWVCGGQNEDGDILDTCYKYNLVTRSWKLVPGGMNIPRQYSSATLSPNGTWIVAGGEDYLRKFRREDNLGFLDSTELLRDQAFDIGPVLPGMMRSHCLTWINNTHLFLTGGMVPSPGKSNRAYLLDTTLDPLAWQPVASMQNTRYSHTCQVVGRDRKQIVITSGFGGGSLVEVFDVDSGTWSTGPELPTTINWYPGSVPYRDSFLLIGGYNYEYMNQLLWLDPSSFSWTKLNQTLKTRRNMFATMLVDDSYCL